jgi:phthalate 4,5-cis-dihydrodiol dehydrogenase
MTSPHKVLRLGIAGLGVAGSQILAAVSAIPYIKITAAADARKNALDRFRREYEAKVFDTVEEMCKSSNVDIVYVATPSEFHAEHVITAASLGKHIVVEKPMAISIKECEEMNAAVQRNGVKLVCGGAHSFSPSIRMIRQVVHSGQLGKLRMINTWNYNEFMCRSRPRRDLAISHGVVLNQGPHQVDIVRFIASGVVKAVRAMTVIADTLRPYEGAYVCYLEFEEGVPATLVYSGYGFFDTSELHWWIGEGGGQRDANTNMRARMAMRNVRSHDEEELLREKRRYGGSGPAEWFQRYRADRSNRYQPFFGLTLVTCERGEIRQSPAGLILYGEEGREEIQASHGPDQRVAEFEELYEAVVNNRHVLHNGRWGEATLEVCLAILESARERREIFLSHQVPTAE